MSLNIIESIGSKTPYSTGTISINELGLIATISGGVFDEDWGEGDGLILNPGGTPETLLVLRRLSSTQLILQNASTHISESGLGFEISRAYSTIENWEIDTSIDLVTAEERRYGICYDDMDPGSFRTITIAGATTNSDHYRRLYVAEGHRHLGRFNAGAATAAKFTITEAYFRMEFLRLTNPTPLAGSTGSIYIVDCLTGNYCTFNGLLIHDWTLGTEASLANSTYMFGMRLSGNKGCRILNSAICNLTKINNDGDDGGMAGIFIGGTSIEPNYIINCAVLNLYWSANYMKADGGITANANTYVHNCIGAVRKYSHDESSINNMIPYGTLPYAEDYSYDFNAINGSHNCALTTIGYLQSHWMPGTEFKSVSPHWPVLYPPSNSFNNVDALDIFVNPGYGPFAGNGFYGYGFVAKGQEPYSDFVVAGKHTNRYLYRAKAGESGVIEFTAVPVFDIVAGYKYIDGSTYGAVKEFHNTTTVDNDNSVSDSLVASYVQTSIPISDGKSYEVALALDAAWNLHARRDIYNTIDGGTLVDTIDTFGDSNIGVIGTHRYTIHRNGSSISAVPHPDNPTDGGGLFNSGVSQTTWTEATPNIVVPEFYIALRFYESLSFTFELDGDNLKIITPRILNFDVNGSPGSSSPAFEYSGTVDVNNNYYEIKNEDVPSVIVNTNTRVREIIPVNVRFTASDISFDSAKTITRVDGSFIEDGFITGTIRVGGAATGVNNKNYTVIDVAEKVLTVSNTVSAEVSGSEVSITQSPTNVPTRTLAGIFEYDTTDGSFIQTSGDAELVDIFEMSNNVIQFKESAVDVDWSTYPTEPSGGSHTPDVDFPQLVSGFTTSGILCIGQKHNDSMYFNISGRGEDGDMNIRLIPDSDLVGAGLNVIDEYPSIDFSELEYDMEGNVRSGFWNIGPMGSNEDASTIIGLNNVNATGVSIAYDPILRNPCFSVGSYTGDLKTGSPNISISDGVATFSIAQTSPGLGAGDVIVFASTTVYLQSKIDASNWIVVSYRGRKPADVASTPIVSIKRCFNTLASAVLYTESITSGMGSLIRTNDFVSANVSPIIFCYDDATYFNTEIDTVKALCQGNGQGITAGLNGYATDDSRRLVVRVPISATECNVSQRHLGMLGRGYQLNVDSEDYAAYFDLIHVTIEGFDIDGSADVGLKFRGFTHSQNLVPIIEANHTFIIKQCLVRNTGTVGVLVESYDASYGFANKAYNKPWQSRFSNCIIWGQTYANIKTDAFGMIAAQMVLYGGQYGIWKREPNSGFHSQLAYCVISNHSISDIINFETSPGEPNYHNRTESGYVLSGIGNQQLVSPNSIYVSPGTSNFKPLIGGELDSMGLRVSLPSLESDPDIGGDVLPTIGQAMSIGAFSEAGSEPITAPLSVFYSVGADIANNLMSGSPNIDIVNGIATFSMEQIGNIGCGDVVIYGSGYKCFLVYKIDKFRWAVTTALGQHVPDSAGAVSSIKRCFVSVNAAIGSVDDDGVTCKPDGVISSSFMNTRDLIDSNLKLCIMCYHTTGGSPDESESIAVPGGGGYGFITDAINDNIIVVEAAGRIGERGTGSIMPRSNTHQGGDGRPYTGYQIQGTNGADDVILFKDCCGVVNGIDVYGSCTNGITFYNENNESNYISAKCKCCIIHNDGEYGLVFGSSGVGMHCVESLRNIIYGQSHANILKWYGVIDFFYVYQNTLDKGDVNSGTIGIEYADSGANIRCGFNAFVGGRAGNDISGMGTAPNYEHHYNIGNDIGFSRNLLWTNMIWNDGEDYSGVFTDRDNGDYNIKDINSPLYNSGTIDYLINAYPGSVQSIKATIVDVSGRFNPKYECCIGALGYSEIFEFDRDAVSNVFEGGLRFAPALNEYGQVNPFGDGRVEGQMVSGKINFYRVSAMVAAIEDTTPADFVKENKVFISLKKTSGIAYNRKIKLVGEFEAYIELINKIIVVKKDMGAGNVLFSNLAGDKNYIFRYNEQMQKLSIYQGKL